MTTCNKNFTADFETTTDPSDCRVWATGICSIDEDLNFEYGNSIEFLFEHFQKNYGSTYYFHNLKFDGEFIYHYLLTHGFQHTTNKNLLAKQFKTLISDQGQHYSIEICFHLDDELEPLTVKIYDSQKIIPFSVDDVAKTFGLPISKLHIDYDEFRAVGHELTKEEIDYLHHDVEIMARALKTLFDQGLTKMTQGSNALFDYKNTVTRKKFKKWFPIPKYDQDIRQSYKGGFTYCDPRKQGQVIQEGIVLDVNSLYPWVMHDCYLPYGEPIFFEGKYKHDSLYFLYIQMFKCSFELKKDHIPTLQLKNNLAFIPTEYLKSSNGEEVTLCMTSVDLKLFFEHYEVYNIEYLSGWKFKGTNNLFREYIDKWTKVKIDASKSGNLGMRTLAKLMLNALYGKFALSPNVQSKIPYLKENGSIGYKLGEKETRDPIYIPVGTFVTAYARYKTITSAQKMYDYFLYADTDSLHLDIKLPDEMHQMTNDEMSKLTTKDLIKFNLPIPEDFEIDPYKLGAWKLENHFTRAKFIRQKTYIEEIDGKLNITCAGLSSRCYDQVTFENFNVGMIYKDKLQYQHVPGGVILKSIDFTIKP